MTRVATPTSDLHSGVTNKFLWCSPRGQPSGCGNKREGGSGLGKAASGPCGLQRGTRVRTHVLRAGMQRRGSRPLGSTDPRGTQKPGPPGHLSARPVRTEHIYKPLDRPAQVPEEIGQKCYPITSGAVTLNLSQPPSNSRPETSSQGKTFPLWAIWNFRSAQTQMSENVGC